MNKLVSTKNFLLLVFGFLAIFGFTRSIQVAISKQGISDFRAWWLAGVYIRDGINPYKASQEGLILNHPIAFFGGTTKQNDNAFPIWDFVPTDTAPVIFLIFPLSFFTLPTANIIYLAINICLVMFSLFLLIKIFPLGEKSDQLLLAFIFWGLLATRVAIGDGQTTPIIFSLILIALLYVNKENWVIPGIALGLTLSKYSLAFPVFLLFCFRKKMVGLYYERVSTTGWNWIDVFVNPFLSVGNN
jgi:hypothetical protein